MAIQNMHKEPNQISIIRGCSALGISRSGYNKWIRQNHIPASDPEEMRLKNEIQSIAIDFPRYGYRRITIELHRCRFQVNHKVVYELMKKDNLLCIKKQFVPKTTDSEHNLPVYPNLTRDLVITGINQLWAADITYTGCTDIILTNGTSLTILCYICMHRHIIR